MSACRVCGVPLAEPARFCSQCGAPQQAAPPAPSRWYYNVWFVLFMISPVALGPFALPLLWKSPGFSRRAQLALTVLTAAWTIWLTLYTVQHVIPAVMERMNQLSGSLAF